MGIRPYKAFTFDGESSLDYGVYLTGEGVFNAPERAVEMVEIPGRNGNFVLDKGRFQNISVTYKAGIVDYSETNFATKMSAVRNWLCSKVGYCRLEDDYNPNEYRMGAFVAGIEVDHDDLQTGQFDIVFDCKPQRWLTSGETAITVSSGDTVTNPTLFDAEPLLAVEGYGIVGFNGYEIELENVLIGTITLIEEQSFTATGKAFRYPISPLNVGDTITVSGKFIPATIPSGEFISITNSDTRFVTDLATKETTFSVDFTHGTYNVIHNTQTWRYSNGQERTMSQIIRIEPHSNTIDGITFLYRSSASQGMRSSWTVSAIADSTMTALGHPTYIDCDIGEAYMIKNGGIVSLNAYIDVGSDLPQLSPGANEFTYDNTVTELQVTPRWWKV